MFSSVIDKIGSLVSRSFVLANFFPFLIFTAAGVALAWLEFPTARRLLTAAYKLETGKQTLAIVVVLIAVAVVAYIFSPLTVAVRRILEGDILIGPRFRERLLAEQRQIADKLKNQRDAASRRDDEALVIRDEGIRRLVEARREGSVLNRLGPRAESEIESAERLLAEVKQLARSDGAATNNSIEALERAVAAAATALCNNSTRLPDTATDPEKKLAKRLSDCHLGIASLLRQVVDDARQDLVRIDGKLRGRFATKGIWPTRLANIRAAAEGHGEAAYQAEFEFLWPRLKLALQKDEKVAPLVELAQARVEFSLLMVLLCGLFTLGWVVALMLLGGSPFTILLLGTVGYWTTFLFLYVVEESVKQLGDLVSATIDFNRFKVLREMDIDLPGNLIAERMLWTRLQQSTTSFGAIDIPYRHGKS